MCGDNFQVELNYLLISLRALQLYLSSEIKNPGGYVETQDVIQRIEKIIRVVESKIVQSN